MSINRSRFFGYIEERLLTLATAINLNGKLNVLNLHNHAENFYLHFLKELFGWNLENFNKTRPNAEAIDLISQPPEKIIIQVSATCTKDKIESAIKKEIMKDYKDYCFKFISISKDASGLRKKTYINPHCISFNPSNDIYDITSILKDIFSLDIDRQKMIYDFIRKELGQEVDIEKLDSNLSIVIDILSKEHLDENDHAITINSFEIERKISFNNLNTTKNIINDYKIHHNRLDKIYSEFDASGVNKSNAVLATIRMEYVKNSNVKKDDNLFYIIISNIQEKIIQSANFNKIPIDVLELCVNILVVDAFIRCKIFENPQNYKYVTTR